MPLIYSGSLDVLGLLGAGAGAGAGKITDFKFKVVLCQLINLLFNTILFYIAKIMKQPSSFVSESLSLSIIID